MADRIQLRRDTKANWENYNPILLEGEPGHVLDYPNFYKMGDGIHTWNQLPYRGYDGTVVQNLDNPSANAVPSSTAVNSHIINIKEIRGIASWGNDFPVACKNSIKRFELYSTQDYSAKRLCLVLYGFLPNYSNLYIAVRRTDDATNIATYIISPEDAGGFTGIKTIRMTNGQGNALDPNSFLIITIDFDTLNGGLYQNYNLVNTPYIVPFDNYDTMPIENSDKSINSGAVFKAISTTPGIVSWGIHGATAITKSIKSMQLLVSKKELLSHTIVLWNAYISTEYNGLYIDLRDITTNSRLGTYSIPNISEYSGVINAEAVEAASDTEDYYSRLIVCINLDIFSDFIISTPSEASPKLLPIFDYTLSKRINLSGIEDIRVYVPDSNKDVDYVMWLLGYEAQYQRFYFRIRKTNDADSPYSAKWYLDGLPSTGKETLSFILDANNAGELYYAEVDIDWSKYVPTSNSNVLSYDIHPQIMPVSSLGEIRGSIDIGVASLINIRENVNLYGKNCVINMYDALESFILHSNASLNNITFVDKTVNAITREEYSAEEIEEKPNRQYIYKPIISLTDLHNEDNETIYGHSTNFQPVINIVITTVNAGVVGCTFKNFNRVAVYDGHLNNRHTTPNHSYITNCMFINCRTGIALLEEFTRIMGNYFFGCLIAWYVRASNVHAVDNLFVRCDCGMYFSISNNAHGEVSTMQFAHIGLAGVYARTINNLVGFIFTNCQFAQAPIIAETAYALKFSSCRLDTYFQIASGAKNSIIGNNMRKAYATDDGVTNIFDVPADTLITLNRSMVASESDDLYNWNN